MEASGKLVSVFFFIVLTIGQDILAEDPNNLGCTFVAVVAGSDKTTVSVATGHQEYHPFYASLGILALLVVHMGAQSFLSHF
jgi:hypothetical protein